MHPSEAGAGNSAARLLAVFLALAIMGSEPLGQALPFSAYAALFLILAWHWKVPFWASLRQPLRLLPVLVVLAAGLPLSRILDRWMVAPTESLLPTSHEIILGVSLLLRAFLAVVLLNLLIQSTGWDGVLRALRTVGLPAGITLTLAHLERYRQLIASEWKRTSLARDARSPGGHRFALSSYSGQMGMVFLRSWERSERVHAAMLSRGFSLHHASFQHDFAASRANLLPCPLWLPVAALCIRLASLVVGGPDVP